MKLKIQARAKINWTLDVVGTLPNGYHDLDMLMQSVTLCDQMTMEEAPQLSLYVRAQGRAFVPADGNNLVLKAAAALQAATGCTRGARITLKKYIPVAAGMGGGSSDAAAALVGLNRLWGLGLSADRLEEIGLTVGADVPFCVRGGLQRAQGVGERPTENNFNELLEFVKKAEFDKLGAFMYSKEEGTPAAKMENQIHGNTKKSRYNKLMKLQQEISNQNLQKRVGNTCFVLVENMSFDRKYYIGRTMQDAPDIDGVVFIKNDTEKDLMNTFVKCKLVEVCNDYDFIATLIEK